MNVLFELSSDPFRDDLASQYARMALAISMENKITLLYRDDAALLASNPFDIPNKDINYFNQERFLVEQEIDIYVVHNEKTTQTMQMKLGVKLIESGELDQLYQKQDVIFRN